MRLRPHLGASLPSFGAGRRTRDRLRPPGGHLVRSTTPTSARPIAATCARCEARVQLQDVGGWGDGKSYCRRCADHLAVVGAAEAKPVKKPADKDTTS